MSDSEEDTFIASSESEFSDEGPKKSKVTKAKAKEPSKKGEGKKAAAKTKTTKTKETKEKTTPKKKKRDDDEDDDVSPAPKKKKGKVEKDDRPYEEIYQKKTPLEHILLRPDTYIGSVEVQDQGMWVYDEGVGMNYRHIKYVPGLYKIFDEILVNAADNYQRDSSMNGLKVTIDPASNTISVWNNGQGIPVEIHAEHGVYIPEMIFGELLTSSNYDDKQKKVTGGRNGYGAKLTNIFSTEFTVETSHRTTKRMFKQTFRNNMGKKGEPVISEAKENDFTKITFKPDLSKFKMTELDEDIVALMTKRVYDIAGCNPSVKVWLNGKRLPVSSFKSYVELYLKEGSTKATVFEEVNDRWEVGVALTDGEFQQVSFVNSICTIRGGTHVEYVAKQVVKAVQEAASKKNKGGADIKPAYVKNHLWVFVRSLIENPAFDSQTKETLMTKVSEFGSTCTLSEDFLKKVVKSEIVSRVLQWSKFQENIQLGKKTAKKRGKLNIAKLDDANNAGTKHSKDCTLILTEGDSAKTQAVAGLGVVGRDNFGAFPLRGKLLNVRDAAFQSISKNKEIENLVKILGLQIGVNYETTDALRYGHLMIMTDQDYDGSHIKGLIINFIHYYWPSLLKIPGYLTEFITPIVKVSKGKKTQYFYTMPEFKDWIESQGNKHGWDVKYLKGLGSNTSTEFKQFFAALDDHRIDFAWEGEADSEAIDMAFSKKRADERKRWMAEYKPGTFLEQNSAEDISYADFVNKELILFSIADCDRSIPSLVDGLKPSQRKVMHACFKRNLKKEIKVIQLAGYVMELCAYHHGETSLHSTTIGLAQDFVGSNNINLLFPGGSFGSRIQGGQDASAPRYINTRLADIARAIFRVEDDPLLDYLLDDGKRIEPKWFMPIIPMVLVNGCAGIGTGWSTFIPCYNPRDIIENLKRMIGGDQQLPMHPWYAGFKGPIVPEPEKKRYKLSGVWKHIDSRTLEITELPIGTWTQDYKEFLLEQMNAEGRKKDCILLKDMKEYHTEQNVHFVIESADTDFPTDAGELEKMLKLGTNINISNMTLFDSEGRIRQWETVAAIMDEFYTLRLQYYDKRKDYMVEALREDWKRLDNKVRFILAVVNKEIIIGNRKKADLLKELREKNFDPFPTKAAKSKKKDIDVVAEDSDEEESSEDEDDKSKVKKEKTGGKDAGAKDYDYLLSMPLWNLTLEKVQELVRQRDEKNAELKTLLNTSAKQLWVRDLDELLAALDVRDAEYAEDQAAAKSLKKKSGKLKPKGKAKRAKMEEGSDEDFAGSKPKKARAAPKKPSATPATPATTATKPTVKKEETTPKAAAKKETTPKAEVKKETKKKDISSYFASPVANDEQDEENMSLAQRLAKKGKPSPFKSTKSDADEEDLDDFSKPKAAANGKAEGAKKAKAKADEDVSEEDEAPKKKRAPAKKAAAKSKAKATSDEDEDEEKAPKKKTTKKAPAKSKAKATSDEDENEEEAPKKKRAPAKKAAAKSKAKPTSDEDEDEDEAPKKKAPAAKSKAKSKGSDDDVIDLVEKRPSRATKKAVDYSKMLKDDDEEDEVSGSGADSEVSLFSD